MLEEKSMSGAEPDMRYKPFLHKKSQMSGCLKKKKRNLERTRSILQHLLQA